MERKEAIIAKLRESIRQKEELVRWHVERDSMNLAYIIAGRIVRQRELVRILTGAPHSEAQDEDKAC